MIIWECKSIADKGNEACLFHLVHARGQVKLFNYYMEQEMLNYFRLMTYYTLQLLDKDNYWDLACNIQ